MLVQPKASARADSWSWCLLSQAVALAESVLDS